MSDTVKELSLPNLDEQAMASWDHEKRKDFTDLFAARADELALVLGLVAEHVLQEGGRLHFLPDSDAYKQRMRADAPGGHCIHSCYGELGKIAQQRAETILKELPAAHLIIEVIDEALAKKMERKAKIEELLTELRKQFEEMPTTISLEKDIPQDWTVGQALKHIKAEMRKRAVLEKRMRLLNEEGRALQAHIAKELYKGVPTLRPALEKVIQQHFAQATQLGEVKRRVTERVLFGDSDEALRLLKVFEKNEVEVSADVKTILGTALEKLGVPKELKAKKKRTKRTTPPKKVGT